MPKNSPRRTDDLDRHYHHTLEALQVQLVGLQRHLIASDARVLIIIEGRDGAGKDGTVKRLTEHMSPRDTRVHAPGKPSDREEGEWYFQRFVPYLPSRGEFVIFNRSWYNRAGVERVMGFATKEQVEDFFASVAAFESMLVRDGLFLRKYYLDISRQEQKTRLADRKKDPLKQWKTSPIDDAAARKWKDYSKARDEMLSRTSHEDAPWRVLRADDKKIARLEFLRDLLKGFSYPGKDKRLTRSNTDIVFGWSSDSELAK
ncbi:MAG TPA: polyphosphate kinase 2 [Rhizomicrobium sp.]